MSLTPGACERLRREPLDARYLPGARNVLRSALGLEPGRELVLGVEASNDIAPLGSAFLQGAEELGAPARVFLVSDETAASAPTVARLLEQLVDSDASLLIGSLTGTPAFRRRVVDAGGARRRHGHMVDAAPALFLQSLRPDFEEVHRLGQRLLARLRRARVVRSDCSRTSTRT